MRATRIAKIAGFSLAGFVAATLIADKVTPNPVVSQLAGFGGAIAGTFMGKIRGARRLAAGAKRDKSAKPEV